MLRELISFVRFLLTFSRTFVRRTRFKGWESAMIYARCSLLNLYVRQRNKRDCEPKAECPCCGWKGYDFRALDGIKFWLPSVLCPQCGSCDRHRMLHLYITRHDVGLTSISGRALHVAPEGAVINILEQSGTLRYFATDLDFTMLRHRPGFSFQADMHDLPVKNDTFDITFCLHVLEHVRDDSRSVSELYRVLKPGGIAYIMVPFDMNLENTVELSEPDEDLYDHMRAYAISDFKLRLNIFDYEEIRPSDFLSDEETRRFRIPDKEIIYRCTKRC